MINITIIGGGIAGLSAATILSEIPNIKISIYEKEKHKLYMSKLNNQL